MESIKKTALAHTDGLLVSIVNWNFFELVPSRAQLRNSIQDVQEKIIG
jgi:hypothetical protein